MTLEVLICTINHRIESALKVPLKEEVEGVTYLISWQQTYQTTYKIPYEISQRKDIKIITTEGKGLSKNRNHALKCAKGDILLLSDDDAIYQRAYFERIIKIFEKNPSVDIFTFQAINENGLLIKAYPTESFVYPNCPYGFYLSSCEIAVRNQKKLPLFDNRLGLGSDFLACGEEEIWIHEAHKQGLKIQYTPMIIVQTTQSTTGTLFGSNKKVRRSKGAVLYLLHGYWPAVLRCVKFVFTHKGFNKLIALKDMLHGLHYIKFS